MRQINDRTADRSPTAILLLVAVFVAFAGIAASSKPAAAKSDKKPNDPLALLEAHCVKCHGGEKTKGGLDLVTREALLRGGESGAAVVPGKPDASLLVQMIRHEKDPAMPHKEKKLPDEAVAQLIAWVKAGVPYRRPLNTKIAGATAKASAEFTITEADRRH